MEIGILGRTCPSLKFDMSDAAFLTVAIDKAHKDKMAPHMFEEEVMRGVITSFRKKPN